MISICALISVSVLSYSLYWNYLRRIYAYVKYGIMNLVCHVSGKLDLPRNIMVKIGNYKDKFGLQAGHSKNPPCHTWVNGPVPVNSLVEGFFLKCWEGARGRFVLTAGFTALFHMFV